MFAPQDQAAGLLLGARIDGGRVLRLLLDSGAQDIVLDKRTAASLERPAGSSLQLVGVGASSKTATVVAPGTVEIGDLVLRNCSIVVSEGKLLEGVDGVIPMSLFAGFLVHLDIPGKTLDLSPYPPDPAAPEDGFTPVRSGTSMLFLQATVNGSEPGYVLLDTGATYNAVSLVAAGAWRNYQMMSPAVPLRGGAGAIDGFLLPPGVRFRLGSRVLSADPAVVIDLSEISRRHQFEVAGVIGYPALRRSVVTINYRDSLVRVDGK